MKVYPDDVWVISYPRCGTNWTMETVWQICNDVDIEDKGKALLSIRFPLLEQSAMWQQEGDTSVQIVQKLGRPRFIWTHLPICFLPNEIWTVKPKIVYVTRNPKDAAISWYHLYYNFYKYSGTIENFFDLFLNGLVEYGSYWDHVKQYQLLQNHYPNLKCIKFEDMKQDLSKIVYELCSFLNKKLTKDKMEVLLKHLHFSSMKSNPAVNNSHIQQIIQYNRPGSDWSFFRNGQSNNFKNEMSEEFIDKFNKMTKDKLE